MVGSALSGGPRHGRVASFDRARGMGTVLDDSGASFGFHATAISDGTRDVAVGTVVAFTVSPGHRGRYEARWLVTVG